MKINIKATGIELTPAISDYATKKVSAIEKYLDRDTVDIVAQVEVGMTSHHHKAGNIFKAEVHITGQGLDFYAVSEQEDLYAAIDLVKDEVAHNISQSKSKRATLTRRGAEAMKNLMKGLSDTTSRSVSWSLERLRFKGFKSFRKGHNINMQYLRQRAASWVTVAVLAGGFVSAIILFWLVKIEASLELTITNY